MNDETGKSPDVWERWQWVWEAVFYASVLVAAALMLGDDSRTVSAGTAGLLTAGLAAWHYFGMRLAYREPEDWPARSGLRFAVLAGDSLLWFALVLISPAYYAALLGLFGLVFRHLPMRYAVAAVLLLTGGTLYEQFADTGPAFDRSDPFLWLYLVLGVASILVGFWVGAIIEQSGRRRDLIERLEATQAELAAAERRAGVLEERQRLAGEIHDTLAQGFTSIVMLMETAEQAIPEGSEPSIGRSLALARDTARNSLEQARRLVWELRPEPLEGASLPDALERVTAGWSERSGMAATYSTTGRPLTLHPQMEIALLRSLQEGLHNAEKHASATAVNVTLSYFSDLVMLDVSDDGVGFDAEAVVSGHGGYGLVAMRERAEKLGGRVVIESEKGAGTALVVELPLREEP